MSTLYRGSRAFIYRNARPLDLARWQYHFEGGSKDSVIQALSYYQNDDGGFGHALEADTWNPNSSPMQTWTATEILRDIEFKDAKHPVVRGILHYLEGGSGFDGKFWHNALESNNAYPHAPWWYVAVGAEHNESYEPTACLAGFILRFSQKGSKLYELGCRIVKQACDQLLSGKQENNMGVISCYILLAQYIEEAGETEIVDFEALKKVLLDGVHGAITQKTDAWETSYICKPSEFFKSPDSIFYLSNKAIADFECEFIAQTQLEDGSWNIPWKWSDYPEQWAISENWWKSNRIINNMLYLKGFGKLAQTSD